jgi:hypothetical protein
VTVNFLADGEINGKVKPGFSTGEKEERGHLLPPLDSNEAIRK